MPSGKQLIFECLGGLGDDPEGLAVGRSEQTLLTDGREINLSSSESRKDPGVHALVRVEADGQPIDRSLRGRDAPRGYYRKPFATADNPGRGLGVPLDSRVHQLTWPKG